MHAYDLTFAGIKAKVEKYHNRFGRPVAVTELAMRNVSADAFSHDKAMD